MDGWMGGWVDGWMDKWLDGWMDERVVSPLYERQHIHDSVLLGRV